MVIVNTIYYGGIKTCQLIQTQKAEYPSVFHHYLHSKTAEIFILQQTQKHGSIIPPLSRYHLFCMLFHLLSFSVPLAFRDTVSGITEMPLTQKFARKYSNQVLKSANNCNLRLVGNLTHKFRKTYGVRMKERLEQNKISGYLSRKSAGIEQMALRACVIWFSLACHSKLNINLQGA